MDLETIANVATALTVLVGVAFGLVEMRRARRDREERAAFAAVRALMTRHSVTKTSLQVGAQTVYRDWQP